MRQAVLVVVVAVVAAAVSLVLWLRTYAPLAAAKPITPGPNLGADVEPTFGSRGKPVLIPAYKAGTTFDVTFTLRNTGRFGVTLTGLEAGRGALAPAALRPGAHVRIDPHDAALVTVRWQLDCTHTTAQFASDRVRLRYRYLSLFRRTETVELPFAVTLRCSGGPPAQP
jgi:hypothetical protein